VHDDAVRVLVVAGQPVVEHDPVLADGVGQQVVQRRSRHE
jgi:hypothetical protein